MAAHWKIAAHSAYGVFSKYKYLIVNLVFPAPGFGVGISFWLCLFLIMVYLFLFMCIMIMFCVKIGESIIKSGYILHNHEIRGKLYHVCI